MRYWNIALNDNKSIDKILRNSKKFHFGLFFYAHFKKTRIFQENALLTLFFYFLISIILFVQDRDRKG